jgi:hypothetical protein
LSRAGDASISDDVAANQVVQVSYRAPRSVLVAFLPGKQAIVTQPTLLGLAIWRKPCWLS